MLDVDGSYALYQLLEKKYGSRLEVDFFRALAGDMKGYLDKKLISITFSPNKYLMFSTAATSREVLEELTPLLKEAMGNVDPICSYDLQYSFLEEKDSFPTIEWDIEDPEGRLKELINGRAFFEDTKTHNLKLFNSKKIEEYLESQNEEDCIESNRVYGFDPGFANPEEINKLGEVDLYFRIHSIRSYIQSSRNVMIHGRIPKVDLTEVQYALEYMIYQTTKFGVELAEPQVGKHIITTPSYDAWYHFYSNHFDKVLTREEWGAFKEAYHSGQDTSSFMPSGSWKDFLPQTTGNDPKDSPKKLIK